MGKFHKAQWYFNGTLKVEALGQSFVELFKNKITSVKDKNFEFLSIIHPEDLGQYKSELKEFHKELKKGKAKIFSHKNYRVLCDSGILRIEEEKSVIEVKDGSYLIEALYFDNTKSLNEKERFELVLSGTGLGLWDWNPSTNEVTFDEEWAKMLGHDLAEIEFNLESWSSRVHPDDLDSCFKDIQLHMEGKTPFYRNIHRMKHKTGKWLYIWDRGQIVERDLKGNPVRFTGTHTDITQRVDAEEKLIVEMKAKESFFALMSHEIRTPLNSIIGFSDLLSEEKLTKDQIEKIELIQNSSKNLLNLINDILDYSKLTSGDVSLFTEGRPLKNFIWGLIKSTQVQDYNGNTINVECSTDCDVVLETDFVKLERILLNFLSNSIKFTEKGKINLVCRKIEDYLDISVEDNGIGISEEAKQKIFKPFVQAEDNTTRNYGGTGLGLTISQIYAKSIGGKIYFESELNKGTSFHIKIPFKIGVEKSAKETSEIQNLLLLKGKQILIVEDNEINMKLIRKILERVGINTTCAGNGQRAIELLKSNEKPDLILMDFQMPIMGGIESTRKIKEDSLLKDIPIVGLTANALDEDRKKAYEAGMDGFLTKPIRKEILYKTLLELIS